MNGLMDGGGSFGEKKPYRQIVANHLNVKKKEDILFEVINILSEYEKEGRQIEREREEK
ncbi:MAG: hypothetical protein Q8920_09615 [Bacillota bacterium]|nr:hypothetical protein [Bacillota bacterium]